MGTKKLYILYEIQPHLISKVNEWIKEKNLNNPTVLIQENSTFKNYSWEYPLYSETDIFPVSSIEEEKIYERVFCCLTEAFKFLNHSYKNINILEDIFKNTCGLDDLAVLASAIDKLLSSYDSVVVCLNYHVYYYDSLLISFSEFSNCDNFSLKYNQSKNKFVYHNIYDSNNYGLETIKNFFQIVCSFVKNKKTKSIDMIDLIKYAGTPCFMFTSGGELFKNNFIPIYKYVMDKNNYIPLLIGPSYMEGEALKNNLKLKSFEEYSSAQGMVDKIKKIYCLVNLFANRNKLKREIAKFLNNDIVSITLKNVFFSYFNYKFFNRIGSQIDLVDSVDFILKHSKPKCVYKQVASSRYDVLIQGICKKLNIPVITGIYASVEDSYRSFGVYPVDYITVLGVNQIQTFLSRGYEREQIIPIGQPELDEIFMKWNDKSSRGYICDTLQKKWSDKRIFLVATSGLCDLDEKKWILHLVELVEHNEDTVLIIKPHPTRSEHYNYVPESDRVLVVKTNIKMFLLIVASNFIFTDASHIGKIVVNFKKPLFVMNYSGTKFPYNNFDEEGVATLISSNTVLTEHFHRCLKEGSIDFSNYQQYISMHMTAADGKTCERIYELLMDENLRTKKHS